MGDLSPDDKLYAVVASRTAIGTTELPVLLFKNPSGSGIVARLKLMIFASTHTVTSGIHFRVYSSPTISADGTALTEASLDIGGGDTPLGQGYSSPTISANGTQILSYNCPAFLSGSSVPIELPNGFQMRANTNLLVTATADGTNRIANVTLFWEED